MSSITFSKNRALIVLFATLYLLEWWFASYDFGLTGLDTLYVSQATLEGVNINARVGLFFKVLATGLGLSAVLYILLDRAAHYLRLKNNHLTSVAVISVAGSLLVCGEIYGIKAQKGFDLAMLLMLLLLVLAGLAARFRHLRVLRHDSFISATIFLALSALTTCFFLFNTGFKITNHGIRLFLLFEALFIVALFFIQRATAFRWSYVLGLAKPIVAAPVLLLGVTELVFIVRERADLVLPHQLLYLLVVVAVIAIPVIRHFAFREKRTFKLQSVSRFYAVVGMLAFLLMVVYDPLKHQDTELFELANPANAIMRIFAFAEIPLLDFMSSHVLSEQVTGIIYSLLNGYKANLDFTVYGFIYTLGFYFLAWRFLRDVIGSSALAVLFLLVFPFTHVVFSIHLFYGVIVLFTMRHAIQHQSTLSYLFVILAMAGLMFWRLDTGSAAIMASMAFLPVLFITQRRAPNWKSLGVATLISAAGFGVAVIIAMILRSPEQFITNLQSAVHYAKAQQAHGYPIIAGGTNQQIYNYHVLMPAVAALASMLIARLLWVRHQFLSERQRFTLLSSLFLFLITLMNFQRGLARHSFAEGSEMFVASTFFLASALLLLYFVGSVTPSGRFMSLICLCFFLFIGLKYFRIPTGDAMTTAYLSRPSVIGLDMGLTAANYEGRIVPDKDFNERNHNAFRQFLDQNLSEEQTFLDFSNTPMLYNYCQRRVPAYFCQNLQNTVDDFLQLGHIARMNPQQVPVAVYSHYPPNGADALDYLPNVMRHYLIAEYIFKHYQPFSVINKRSIWTAKQQSFQWKDRVEDTIAGLPKTYDYKKAAGYIYDFLEKEQWQDMELIKTVDLVGIDSPTVISLADVADESHLFLSIEIENGDEVRQAAAEIVGRDTTLGGFTFEVANGTQGYTLRLTNLYQWHVEQARELSLFLAPGMRAKKIMIYKDLRL